MADVKKRMGGSVPLKSPVYTKSGKPIDTGKRGGK